MRSTFADSRSTLIPSIGANSTAGNVAHSHWNGPARDISTSILFGERLTKEQRARLLDLSNPCWPKLVGSTFLTARIPQDLVGLLVPGPALNYLRRPFVIIGERMPRRSGREFWIVTVIVTLGLIGALMALDYFLRSV